MMKLVYLEGTVLDVSAVYPDPHAVSALAGQTVHYVILPTLPRHHLDLDEARRRPGLDHNPAHGLNVTSQLSEAGARGHLTLTVSGCQTDHCLLASCCSSESLSSRLTHAWDTGAAHQAAHAADGGLGLLQPTQRELDVVSVGGGRGLAVADGLQTVTDLRMITTFIISMWIIVTIHLFSD